jgi:hypothetical protein
MVGKPLKSTLLDDTPIRETGLFGMHSGHINITDGIYVYMRAPGNEPLYNYTLMPTHLCWLFSVEELRKAELAGSFDFTKGCPLLKVKAHEGSPGGEMSPEPLQTMLFNLKDDPVQEHPIQDEQVEACLIEAMKQHLQANDAPEELYRRMGL